MSFILFASNPDVEATCFCLLDRFTSHPLYDARSNSSNQQQQQLLLHFVVLKRIFASIAILIGRFKLS